MKRSLLTFLAILLSSILLLSACGSNDEEETETEEETSEELEETTEENEEETSNTQDENEEEEPADESGEPSEEAESDESTSEETNREAESGSTEEDNENTEEDVVVEENEVFRLYEPEPNSVVGTTFTVRGEAMVNGGNVYYEFEDGHNILDEGVVTASNEAPEWGEFEITITFDEVAFSSGTIILYEESEDASRQNQLYIPVTVE
jgi:cytoskeletal protein RodZ